MRSIPVSFLWTGTMDLLVLVALSSWLTPALGEYHHMTSSIWIEIFISAVQKLSQTTPDTSDATWLWCCWRQRLHGSDEAAALHSATMSSILSTTHLSVSVFSFNWIKWLINKLTLKFISVIRAPQNVREHLRGTFIRGLLPVFSLANVPSNSRGERD